MNLTHLQPLTETKYPRGRRAARSVKMAHSGRFGEMRSLSRYWSIRPNLLKVALSADPEDDLGQASFAPAVSTVDRV